jgi:hypothetical protein
MKIIKAAAVSALLCTSILSTPAFADFTDGTADITGEAPAGITDAAAQAVCTNLAAAHTPAVYTGTLEPGSIEGAITTPPTSDGPRTDQINLTGTGDQIPETVQVHGDPFRIGGSVNMFGFASVEAAHWTDSTYDFMQHFVWQSTYTFTCNMAEIVPVGTHTWLGLPDTTAQSNCEGDKNPHPTDDRGANCPWTQTGTEAQDRTDEQGAIGPVNEGGTLSGHENSGGPIPVDPNQIDLPDVQVVVCISPSTTTKKLPGAWTAKNGYSGGSSVQGEAGCNTGWYNGGAKIQPSPYDNLNTGSNNIVTIPAT